MAYNNNNGFLGNVPPVTRNILIINVIVCVAVNLLRQVNLTQILGLHYFQADTFYLYQFITYMFTHASFPHIFFNMFAVFMFGSTLENYWGSKKYLIYYLVTGIGAGIVQEVTLYFSFHDMIANYTTVTDGIRTMTVPQFLNQQITIGASGSVFGLLLAFGMLFPNTPLYILFFPTPIKAKYMVIGYGILELLFGVAGIQNNVAHFAHLGGMLFGIFLILYWKKKNKNNNGFHYY